MKQEDKKKKRKEIPENDLKDEITRSVEEEKEEVLRKRR